MGGPELDTGWQVPNVELRRQTLPHRCERKISARKNRPRRGLRRQQRSRPLARWKAARNLSRARRRKSVPGVTSPMPTARNRAWSLPTCPATSTAGRPTAVAGLSSASATTTSISTGSLSQADRKERLTSDPGFDDGPDYSVNGKWIYITQTRGAWDIWRFPAEGAGH